MQIEKVYLMVNSQKSKYAHNLLETMFGRNQFGDRMLWISDGGQVNWIISILVFRVFFLSLGNKQKKFEHQCWVELELAKKWEKLKIIY